MSILSLLWSFKAGNQFVLWSRVDLRDLATRPRKCRRAGVLRVCFNVAVIHYRVLNGAHICETVISKGSGRRFTGARTVAVKASVHRVDRCSVSVKRSTATRYQVLILSAFDGFYFILGNFLVVAIVDSVWYRKFWTVISFCAFKHKWCKECWWRCILSKFRLILMRLLVGFLTN